MRGTSYTQPPQLPPLTLCSAAQSSVSAGTWGLATSFSLRGRAASSSADPTKSTDPSSRRVSIRTRSRSPSRSLPSGPPAQASGLMWPMQGPVDTPENRPSVISATLSPSFWPESAEVTVYALLIRMERRGLVDVEKVPSEKGPPRKVYSLNARGREQLEEFGRTWAFLSDRIEHLYRDIDTQQGEGE